MTKSTGIHYEAITYRSTLIKPAYCIFCLWDDNDNLDTPSRMRSFSRSHDLRRHLETHVIDMKWPGVCPDGSCSKPFNYAQDFRRHLHDIHTYHKSVWQSPASTCNRVGLSKSKSTQSRGQRSPSTTKKLQTPKFIQWQPPANLEDSRISTQSPVTPQPFRHATVLQLPPDESKIGSTHNSKLQDMGLENPHVTSPPSQHDTPELDNFSSNPSLSNTTANSPNLLPIDPQILDGEELVETGDHSVQLYPNEGDGRRRSNGGDAISVHDKADAHILDEQLSAKQRADSWRLKSIHVPTWRTCHGLRPRAITYASRDFLGPLLSQIITTGQQILPPRTGSLLQGPEQEKKQRRTVTKRVDN